MKTIIGKVGTGKTKALIEESAKTWAYIVCPSLGRANDIQKFAKELGLDIPLPITHGEFIAKTYSPKGIRGFLIDDVEMLLQRISMVNVMGLSIGDYGDVQILEDVSSLT